jgi:hypothetical protein
MNQKSIQIFIAAILVLIAILLAWIGYEIRRQAPVTYGEVFDAATDKDSERLQAIQRKMTYQDINSVKQIVRVEVENSPLLVDIAR